MNPFSKNLSADFLSLDSEIIVNDQGVFTLVPEECDAGKRLDVFITDKIVSVQRSRVSQSIENGECLVNGVKKKSSYRIKPSDIVSGVIPPLDVVQFFPEDIPLDILYEDDDIIVINKQPGLVVHPAPGHWSGTLVNGLLFHCPEIATGENYSRPGIVHRLDMDTSGVMIVAKNQKSLLTLSESFQARTVRKEYVALVHGRITSDTGTVDAPIGRHPVDRKRMCVVTSGGKKAVTHYYVEKRYHHSTLIRCDIETGRTHQIRVHCHSIHHPIVGDGVYQSSRTLHPGMIHPDEMKALKSAARQMLHSHKLTIQHPKTLETMKFQAPLPSDMVALIGKIESCSSDPNSSDSTIFLKSTSGNKNKEISNLK